MNWPQISSLLPNNLLVYKDILLMWGLLNPNKPMAAQNSNSNLHAYIKNINRLYVQGRATEHSYRGDLAQLIEAIVPDIKAINEPKNDTTGKVWINDE